MIGQLITKIGIPVLADTLSDALGRIDHPAAQGASKALDELNKTISAGQISVEQIAEANRHAEKMAEMDMQEAKSAYEQVNESLRAEVASEDAYVRRMRPTFGYLMAFTWAAQMFALAWVIIFRTAQASAVLMAMESLGTIWAVGLSVLGIYVYKRSEDKKLEGSPRKEIIFWDGPRKTSE